MSADFLPYALPDIGDAEIDAVAAVLREGWVTTGPEAAKFEREFASRVNGEVHAVAVNSATAGLHLTLEAFGIGPGDEVVVPTWTFTATAEVVRYLGAVPVVVDVDPVTLNMDIGALTEALTPRTKAVIVVHFAGLSMNMELVARALEGHSVKIIEDAAHALPSVTNGVMVGSVEHSDAAVFSFYANKTMTTGEGGMITTRDAGVAERVKVMRLHGIDRDVFDRYTSAKPSWFYDVVAPGFKYNMPDPSAAMGRVQLRRLGSMHEARQRVAASYLQEFRQLPVDLPATPQLDDVHAWHVFVLRLRDESPISRDDFVDIMTKEKSIGTSVHFIPLHRHTYWSRSLSLERAQFPIAEHEFQRAISLPIFSRMNDEDTSRVVAAVKDLLE